MVKTRFGWVFSPRNKNSAMTAVAVGAVLAAAACGPISGHHGASDGSGPTLADPSSAATSVSLSATGSADPATSESSSGSPTASSTTGSADPTSADPTSLAPTTGTSSSSAPTTSASTSSASSSSASTGSSSYSCVTSVQPHGTCGPYPNYPRITGTTDEPYVDQNVWGGNSTYQQTLHANSPGDWYVVANATNPDGSVLTYPNTGWLSTGTVDGLSTTTSSYSVTMPANSNTFGWAAYDLWFNNWNDEVMIQTDLDVNSSYDCDAVATATFSGSPWHLCVFGSERVWKPGTDDQHLNNQPSGSIDAKAMLQWLEQNGYLPKSSTWTGGSFGFEICNTRGTNQKFAVNSFSWIAN